MQTHANEAMHDGGSRGWSLITLVYLHCCDYLLFRVCFHSIVNVWWWEEAQPENLQVNFISSRLPQSVFSPKPCRRCILLISPKPQRRLYFDFFVKIMSPMYFDDVFGHGDHAGELLLFEDASLICFLSNLHVSGFSSCRITQMIHSCLVWFLWWLRHCAIGPIEATPVGVNVDWIDFRIYTFELVIRLSNVQQMALPFCAFDEVPRLLWSQGFLADAFLHLWSRSEHSETSFFRSNLCSFITCDRTQAGTRSLGVVFFLLMVLWWGQTYCAPNSLELESRLCLLWLTWTRAWSGTMHDF